jgi:DNA repair exonuclease SbcCD ATPase subunit
LGGLAALPEIAPTRDLEELIGRTAGVMQGLSPKRQERDSLEEALKQKRAEVEELIRETGLCPLCGSPMDVSHFLEAVHG